MNLILKRWKLFLKLLKKILIKEVLRFAVKAFSVKGEKILKM